MDRAAEVGLGLPMVMGVEGERRRAPGIRQTPSGKWQARYRDPAGRLRGKTFRRKTDAQAFLSGMKADLLRGEWRDPSLRRASFREVVDLWLPSIADLERTTRAQRELELRVRLLPRFGDRAIGSIADFDVEQLKSDLLASGLAPSTVTKCLMTLSQIFKAAVTNGFILRNPCDSVRKPGEEPLAETVFLSADEINALADAFPPRFAPMVLLAGYRGMRFGEVAGLRPGRLKLDQGKVEIVEALKEVGGELYFGLPKHDRRRHVGLPPFLVTILKEHMESFPPVGDLVFVTAEGSLLRRSNFSRRVWGPAVRSAGVDQRVTFHGLRHSAVSLLIAGGASIVELASVMGWSKSTAAAMSVRYGHLFQEREHHLVDAVEAMYQKARGSAGPI